MSEEQETAPVEVAEAVPEAEGEAVPVAEPVAEPVEPEQPDVQPDQETQPESENPTDGETAPATDEPAAATAEEPAAEQEGIEEAEPDISSGEQLDPDRTNVIVSQGRVSTGADDVKLIDSDAVLIDSLQTNLSQEALTPQPSIVKNQDGQDTLTVTIKKDNGATETVTVVIKQEAVRKAFLGGWKHRETGKEYHNSSVQTIPKRNYDTNMTRSCRETQTVTQKNERCQTTSDTSTQMTKTGCWVSDREDKVIIPGKYVSADDKFAYMLRQVIILQSYFRRWKARKYVDSIRQDHIRRIEWEKKEEERKRKEKERRLREEYQRRMQPLGKEDFDLVYHALELWRREEVENINATKSGPERKAALAGLMDEETQLIASIQRHKLIAKTETNKKKKKGFLDRCAAPKEWIGFDGMPTKMDTPYTMRAKDLKMTYESLDKRYLTREERLDILLQLKLTVKEHDCKLTKDIVELIDREADLLMRGTKEKNLEGLRQRISTLFLQYIKTPLFNPEAANLLKVPEDPSSLRKNIYYCRGCGNYLPSTDFELTTNARTIGRCRKCKDLDGEGRLREDFSRYRSLLQSIRETEESYSDSSRIIFLLTEADLRYLAENIWGAQSVLSQWEDTYDLTLVRWNKRKEWSPWNCILLTNEEARAHSKLAKPEEAYGTVFTQKVKYRHILGKQHFASMPKLADYMNKNLKNVNMPLPSNADKVMFGGMKKNDETLSLPPLAEGAM